MGSVIRRDMRKIKKVVNRWFIEFFWGMFCFFLCGWFNMVKIRFCELELVVLDWKNMCVFDFFYDCVGMCFFDFWEG